VIVETVFVHESGETFSAGKLHVPAVKHDAQGYGSALTYARRYSLMAACGIAPEDDDGNAASKPQPRQSAAKVSPANGPELMTEEDVANITALADEVGKSVKDIVSAYKVSALNFIPRSAFPKIVARLEAARNETTEQ
jgi:hypothetical protein